MTGLSSHRDLLIKCVVSTRWVTLVKRLRFLTDRDPPRLRREVGRSKHFTVL